MKALDTSFGVVGFFVNLFLMVMVIVSNPSHSQLELKLLIGSFTGAYVADWLARCDTAKYKIQKRTRILQAIAYGMLLIAIIVWYPSFIHLWK